MFTRMEGKQLDSVLADGPHAITFAVPAGKTTLRITPADPGTAPPPDTRAVNLHDVQGDKCTDASDCEVTFRRRRAITL